LRKLRRSQRTSLADNSHTLGRSTSGDNVRMQSINEPPTYATIRSTCVGLFDPTASTSMGGDEGLASATLPHISSEENASGDRQDCSTPQSVGNIPSNPEPRSTEHPTANKETCVLLLPGLEHRLNSTVAVDQLGSVGSDGTRLWEVSDHVWPMMPAEIPRYKNNRIMCISCLSHCSC
jgi:hypothetical protein